MGNSFSPNKNTHLPDCHLCNNRINSTTMLVCIQCNKMVHEKCEYKYRGTKGYYECPNCKNMDSYFQITKHDKWLRLSETRRMQELL